MTNEETYRAMNRLLSEWLFMGHLDERGERLWNVDWSDDQAVDDEIEEWIVIDFRNRSADDRRIEIEALDLTLDKDDQYIDDMMKYFEIGFECSSFRNVLERVRTKLLAAN